MSKLKETNEVLEELVNNLQSKRIFLALLDRSGFTLSARMSQAEECCKIINKEIHEYLKTYRSRVQLSLIDIQTRFGTVPFNDREGLRDLGNRIEKLKEERNGIMNNLRNETVYEINCLQEDVTRIIDDAYDWDGEGASPSVRVRMFVQSYLNTFLETPDDYLLFDAIAAVKERDLENAKYYIDEFSKRRTLEIIVREKNERREKMYNELKRVDVLYKDIVRFVEAKLNGEHPEIAIEEAIDKFQLETSLGGKYWGYLDAIKYMTWTKGYEIDFKVDCILSDIKTFRDSMITWIAEENDMEVGRCEYCGELDLRERLYDGVEDEPCCRKCFEERFFVCDECGETLRLDAGYRVTIFDTKICDDCYEEEYFTCEDCGNIFPNSDKNFIEHYDCDVCNDCYNENYVHCYRCGEILHKDDAEWSECDQEWFCSDCFWEDHTLCEDCGDEILRDNAIWVDSIQASVCESCYKAKYGVIYDWHDDDIDFNLNSMPYESLDNKITIGIEHEVTGSEEFARGLDAILNTDKVRNVFFCRDGSVSGFEIVSNPMTVRYFYEEFLPVYKKGLEYLQDKGFSGADGGGIHIHFKGLETQMHIARACNILYGDMDAQAAWLKISNRRKDKLEDWCSMSNRKHSTLDILQGDYHNCSDGRYTALNYDGCRTNTHELRIFNSTLSYEEYIAYVQVTIALAEFCRTDIGKGAYVTTRDYLEWLYDNRGRFGTAVRILTDRDVFEDYGIGEVQIPLDFNVGDVELTQEDHEEIEGIVNSLFNNDDVVSNEAVG